MKLKNKLSILLTISPIMVSPLFLAASCKEKDKNNPQLKEFKDKLENNRHLEDIDEIWFYWICWKF